MKTGSIQKSVGFQYRNDAGTQDQTQQAQSQHEEFDMRHLYYQALEIAFQKFIVEERLGNSFTEARLVKAIEGARAIFKSSPFSFDSPQGRAWHAQFQER